MFLNKNNVLITVELLTDFTNICLTSVFCKHRFLILLTVASQQTVSSAILTEL